MRKKEKGYQSKGKTKLVDLLCVHCNRGADWNRLPCDIQPVVEYFIYMSVHIHICIHIPVYEHVQVHIRTRVSKIYMYMCMGVYEHTCLMFTYNQVYMNECDHILYMNVHVH